MNNDGVKQRKDLTFEEAEGLVPLPKQLARTEVSQELRAVLWKYIHEQIDETAEAGGYGYHLGKPWNHILKEVHDYREHKLVDDFSSELTPARAAVRKVFERGSYADIYGWLHSFFTSKARESSESASRES